MNHDKRELTALSYRAIDTELGPLTLVASSEGLASVLFGSFAGEEDDDQRARAHLDAAQQQLDEYLSGRRREFTVVMDFDHPDFSGSEFQKSVQRGLLKIPYGETVSYGELAEMVGHPGAARAVGTACAKNPLPILLPCHRVVRADTSRGLYGGGSDLKDWLLDMEMENSSA